MIRLATAGLATIFAVGGGAALAKGYVALGLALVVSAIVVASHLWDE